MLLNCVENVLFLFDFLSDIVDEFIHFLIFEVYTVLFQDLSYLVKGIGSRGGCEEQTYCGASESTAQYC